MAIPDPAPGPPLAPDVLEPPVSALHGGHATMPHGKLPPSFMAKPGVHRATTPEMGGPLLVTPAGTTLVATDALHAHLDQITTLGDDLAGESRALAILQGEAGWSAIADAPSAARRSESELEAARRSVDKANRLSGRRCKPSAPRSPDTTRRRTRPWHGRTIRLLYWAQSLGR